MKVPSAVNTALPYNRTSFYSKKRSPPPSLAKQRKESPLRDSVRRTPSELVAAEVLRQTAAQMADLEPLLELEYQQDVKAYMFDMETRTTASVDLIDQQPELQWYMRPYLVDFLIEIHQQFRLRPETLYLALNIVDRYVSKRIVFKKHYQLVGCASLWIAAKFEDAKDRVPTVPELCQMCCGAYDESAFIQMEGHVLSTINWVIGHPTTEAWLRLACVTGQLEEQRTQHVARFIMEITLFHKEYIPFKPSDLALASLLLARYMLGKSRRVHDESEKVLSITQMLDAHLGEHLDTVSVIVVKKYSYPFYSRASTFVREWYLSGRRFAYYDWTASPSRRSGSVGSSPAAPSSCALVSSPSNSGSDSSSSTSDDDDSCDEDEDEPEPLTPSTPLPPYSSSNLFSEPPAGKENLTRPEVKLIRDPLSRPPLHRWATSSSGVPSYRP